MSHSGASIANAVIDSFSKNTEMNVDDGSSAGESNFLYCILCYSSKMLLVYRLAVKVDLLLYLASSGLI